MSVDDIEVGSFWARVGNSNPMRVLAVVEGFVMYRHKKHHPGAVAVDEWLRTMHPMGRQVSRTPTRAPARSPRPSTPPRVRRTR